MENIQWLTNWFLGNCDGDWEHSNIVTIQTIDNPGWMVRIDISETSSQGKQMSKDLQGDENDWMVIKCDGAVFEAFGDPTKLNLLIEYFRLLVDN